VNRQVFASLGVIGGVVAIVLIWPTTAVVAHRAAQPEVTESDLVAVSGGRTVRIGVGVGRKPTTIPVEVYVARVLAGEGEPRAADAAQQALAVAIRTYASMNQGRHGRDGYDLCDTTHCQVVRSSSSLSRRAALVTAGQVLLHEGRPAELFYSASCGGRTAVASTVWRGMPEYPYLISVQDHVHADDVPWTLELTERTLLLALSKVGFSGQKLLAISVDERTGSGRVGRLHLHGLRPSEISGQAFREAVGPATLRSTDFSVRRIARGYRFTGRGFGHGVGMCVIGAGRLAARGESAAEILALYYPGLQLLNASVSSTAIPITSSSSHPVPKSVSVTPAPLSQPITASVVVRAVDETAIDRQALETMAGAAYRSLSATLGVAVSGVTIEVHPTMDGFRAATGQPWWVSSRVRGTTIDLSPSARLAQRDGLEFSIRAAIAELLVERETRGRPRWIQVGAARYYARQVGGTLPAASLDRKLVCPADDELTLALSAPALREAEWRAEVCFARARPRVSDWRAVK
jgi:stage II sporulation protein D